MDSHPHDLDNYKSISYGEIRFNLVLISILDEVAERWGAQSDQVFLYGFSGGGQFVHRFASLHPRRLAAVSVGAPGRTTLRDPDASWPDGTGDTEPRFGLPVDLEALARVPAQVVVGADDTDPFDLAPGSVGGTTGVERAERLVANWRRNGISVQLDVVAGAAHDSAANLPAARSFLATHLTERRR
jgi:pimeloyl-ACP methyl ester carboxylesterase